MLRSEAGYNNPVQFEMLPQSCTKCGIAKL